MSSFRNLVILTGAGISAESGLATFRGPDGLWEGHRVEDVCTPEALRRDADLVHRFYDERRAKLPTVAPNAAHEAIARLSRDWPGDILVVTQNVDDLHDRTGTRNLIHMHGALCSALCAACGHQLDWDDPLPPGSPCPACSAPALRPDIVFFGEMPYHMEQIEMALRNVHLFIAIGTSGQVYPAAGCVQTARYVGARCIEVNVDPTATSPYFHDARIGPASIEVPRLVEDLLPEARP